MKSKNNLKVLLVSNNKYGEGLADLFGANYITEQLYNYFKCIVLNPDEDVVFLKDKNHTNTIDEIFDFIEKIHEDCIFLFYFCGHGKMDSHNISELIMALKDTTSQNFDSIGIKFSDIVHKVKKENITKFICVVDSCCSGIINSHMGENELTFNESDCNDGTVYISSVKGTLNAYEIEINGKKVPCFSYSFLKALTERDNSDPYNIEEIFIKTKKYLSSLNSNMNPQITCKNSLCKEKIFPNAESDDTIYNILDVIDWRITSQCDNKCGMCYACNDNQEIKDLSDDQIDIVIKKLSQIHCKTICISGGEPTKSKHFVKIMRELYQNGFSIFLSTNGYKYMDYQDEIETYIEKLSLPLDGYNEETNTYNGRNPESFEHVKNILDYYNKHEHDFSIKISTVLTRKTNNIEFLLKILEFIRSYNISIWKIYEFIPENRGAENKENYLSSKAKNREVQSWINKIKHDLPFKIELVERKKRDAAYFIIQSNGVVIIPVENNDSKIVCEKEIGNIINNDLKELIIKWRKYVDENNYYSNAKLRNIKQLYFLKPFEKNILHNFISNDCIPSLKDLSDCLKDTPQKLETIINKLYKVRVIKNIIPIINLKIFGINTYLANLTFSKYTNCPDGFIEDYLCYNAHIGWVTKCENNIFRIAIFATSKEEVGKILQEIKKDLNDNIKYDCYDLICSYAVGEKKLFLNSSREISASVENIKYNSNTQKQSSKVKLSYEEFYSLMQLENLRKPLKENVDNKVFLNTNINFNSNIQSLLDKGIIEKLSVILDTRLLGYNWYIVFVNVYNTEIDALIEFLRTQFNNITHINSFVPQKSDWNLDFEVHVTSFAEVNEIIEKIEKQFANVIITPTPLKIIKECKFSFLNHYTSDVIMKNYILEDEEGEC